MFLFSFLHTSMHVPELPYPSENWKISCQTNRKFILQTRNANKSYQNMSHLSYVAKIKWWAPKDFLILWFFQKCMIFLTIPRLILFFRYTYQKIKKKSRPKKLVKSNRYVNQFHDFFLPNSIFCNFKNGQKSIFELGEKFKTAKNAI